MVEFQSCLICFDLFWLILKTQDNFVQMAPKRKKEKLAIDTGESSNPYLQQGNEHIRENNMKLHSLGLPSMMLPVGGTINFQKNIHNFTFKWYNWWEFERSNNFFLNDLYTLIFVMMYVLCIANYVLLCCYRCGKRKVSTNICATSFPSQWDSDFIRQTMHVFWGSQLWTDIQIVTGNIQGI